MQKNIICVACPMGCGITVELADNGDIISVTGNTCKRGQLYGVQEFTVPNPDFVQLPLIRQVVEHLQDKAICHADCVSATPVNWVVDRILGKI